MVDSDLMIKVGVQLVADDVADQLTDLSKGILTDSQTAAAARSEMQANANATSGSRAWFEVLQQMKSMDTSSLEGDTKKNAELTKFLSQGFNKISGTLQKGTNMAFDVVDRIYKELKKSSPLLQTLEQLFNLAMQLFFMPLGNKLAEVLLPAVIEMLDAVVSLWDELGDGSLESMFEVAFKKGINIIGNTLKTMGSTLSSNEGLLGSIGRALTALGNFIQGPGAGVLNLIVDLVTFVISNLKQIIATIIAFKVASLAMQLITQMTIATGNSIGGWFGAGLVVAAGGAAYLASEALLSDAGLAEGGYAPATEGGMLVNIAEGGEGEYVIPESKLNAYQSIQSLDSKLGTGASVSGGGGNTYYINLNGMTWEDAKSYVKDIVSEQISLSRLRGGF